MHQGWPKFAANLWMATPDRGLAAVAYGPSEVRTVVADGVAVKVTEETEYPFRETINLSIDPAKPAKFTLELRIPAWADGPTVAVNGASLGGVRAGQFYSLNREWKAGDRLSLRFPMLVRNSTWYNKSIAVERGPLVYSLKIGESWHKSKQTGPAADWEVYPTTPWNYALVIDKESGSFQVAEKPVGTQPFSLDGAPVEIRAKARRLPEWQIEHECAGPLPLSPVVSKQPLEAVSLIPYGAAKLRITAFPYTPQ